MEENIVTTTTVTTTKKEDVVVDSDNNNTPTEDPKPFMGGMTEDNSGGTSSMRVFMMLGGMFILSIFGLSYVSIYFEDNMYIYFLRQLVNERLSSVNIPESWGKPTLGPNTTGLGQVFWYQLHDKNGKYSCISLNSFKEYLPVLSYN
jgi:cobalt-zinc-cadmium resistance protein CzcA